MKFSERQFFVRLYILVILGGKIGGQLSHQSKYEMNRKRFKGFVS